MNIEESYREGYAAGYAQGEDDGARENNGDGKIRPNTRKKNRERSWQESEAFKSVAQKEMPFVKAEEAGESPA